MDKIEIKGYKSIKNLSLELRQINILIGANGSGKSNLLSFFDMLQNLYRQNLQQYVAIQGGVDRFLYGGRKITDCLYSHLYFGKNGYSITLEPGENSFIISKEGLWYDRSPYYNNPHDISNYSMESRLSLASVPRAGFIRHYLDALEKYHFHDTSRKSPFTHTSNIHSDAIRLYGRGENLASFLYGIRKENIVRYNLIVRTIQSIAPYFFDFYLEPNENGDIRLLWRDKYTSNIYSINDMSDGTKRFVALCVLFLQPKLPETIIIDEPELGLHPSAISKLSGMIKSVAAKGCQVIAATQSVELINYFEPKDIVTVDQTEEGSVFERLEDEEFHLWLEDYAVGDLWKQRIITNGQPTKGGTR